MESKRERPTSTYDADYSDKFRKFSEAVIDKDKDVDSIEMDFNYNSSVSSRNGGKSSAARTPQVSSQNVAFNRCKEGNRKMHENLV